MEAIALISLIVAIAVALHFFGPTSTAGFSIESDGIALPTAGAKIRWEQITDAAIKYEGEDSEPQLVLHVENGYEINLRRYPRWLRVVAETFHPEKSDEIPLFPERQGIDPKTLLMDIKVQIVLARGRRS